mmetsp:Transcript_15612/g.41589  ORF Transcript_15612/g.41589 Transcript_15612/m.41589 type:complete len:226 (+) Transcript_15612:2-679(+)
MPRRPRRGLRPPWAVAEPSTIGGTRQRRRSRCHPRRRAHGPCPQAPCRRLLPGYSRPFWAPRRPRSRPHWRRRVWQSVPCQEMRPKPASRPCFSSPLPHPPYWSLPRPLPRGWGRQPRPRWTRRRTSAPTGCTATRPEGASSLRSRRESAEEAVRMVDESTWSPTGSSSACARSRRFPQAFPPARARQVAALSTCRTCDESSRGRRSGSSCVRRGHQPSAEPASE